MRPGQGSQGSLALRGDRPRDSEALIMTTKQELIKTIHEARVSAFEDYTSRRSLDGYATEDQIQWSLDAYRRLCSIQEAALYASDELTPEERVDFAYILGRFAFDRGIRRACALDRLAQPLFRAVEVGNPVVRDALTAWLKGWDTANLTAARPAA